MATALVLAGFGCGGSAGGGGGYKNNRFYSNTVQGGLSVRAVDGEFGGGNQLYDNILFDGTIDTDQGSTDVEVAHDYGVTSYNNPYDYFSIADYNLFWRSDGTAVHIGGNEGLFSTQLTLSEWNAGLTGAGVPAAVRQANSLEDDPEFVSMVTDNYRLANNGQGALVGSSTGGPVGCYITGAEEIGLRANPTY